MELGRLDRLQAVHRPKAVSGDVPATNTVLAIMHWRASYLGAAPRVELAEAAAVCRPAPPDFARFYLAVDSALVAGPKRSREQGSTRST